MFPLRKNTKRMLFGRCQPRCSPKIVPLKPQTPSGIPKSNPIRDLFGAENPKPNTPKLSTCSPKSNLNPADSPATPQ